MGVTKETIDSYFEQYGWTYTYEPEHNIWRTGFRGDVASFRIALRVTDNWAFFVIAPFVLKPKDPECERRLYRHLLRLNYEINMAKFTVDPDGDITLTVELPTENLDYSEFADAINALSYYADEHYLEILNLAQDPTARSRFEPEAEDLDWGES